MPSEQLSMWVIYEKPLDHPDQYVARRWVCDRDAKPTTDLLHAKSLELLRKQLPPGLSRINRAKTDHPIIVESWM